MLIEELFPIWFSPDEDSGGNGDDAEDQEESEEEEEEGKEEGEEEEDFDKPLALRTIRKQREEYRDMKKKYRTIDNELKTLKKQQEDKDKNEIELASQQSKESVARAAKAEQALKNERIRSAVIRVAAIEGMRDPEDAYLNLRDSDAIEFEDEDEFKVDTESVKDAIADLKKEKPYLFETEEEEEEDEDEPGGSPIRRKVRSRIKKAEKDQARIKREAAEKLKPDVVISTKF